MNSYLLFKSLHLIAVISWMAGLLYLPRIFVYHSENNNEIISTGVLACRLKRLTDIGLLLFKDDPEHSQRKIYCLSPAAIDLVPLLLDMSAWALTHASGSEEPIALPSGMERPQSQFSKELTDRLRTLHLEALSE